jgi:hypothetical protein
MCSIKPRFFFDECLLWPSNLSDVIELESYGWGLASESPACVPKWVPLLFRCDVDLSKWDETIHWRCTLCEEDLRQYWTIMTAFTVLEAASSDGGPFESAPVLPSVTCTHMQDEWNTQNQVEASIVDLRFMGSLLATERKFIDSKRSCDKLWNVPFC